MLKKAIKENNEGYLQTEEDTKIFNTLKYIDEDILKVLVDYYSNISQDNDLFRSDSRDSQVIEDEDVDLNFDKVTDVKSTTDQAYTENKHESNNLTNSNYATALYDLRSRNLSKNIGFTLNGEVVKLNDKSVLFDSDEHKKLENSDQIYNYTSGLSKLLRIPNLNVIAKSNADITSDDIYQYLVIIKESGIDIENNTSEFIKNIKINTALQKIDQLNIYYPTAKAFKGKGVRFLSSDPKTLMNRLKILLAEKDAGNNNVLDEISAIADELRRSGAISMKQLKNLYKKITLDK